MKAKIFDIAVIISFALVFIICIAGFENTSEGIRGQVMRLHVIADDDTAEAQRIKLKVRDAIIEGRGELFEDAENLADAESITEENLLDIGLIAAETMRAEGYNKTVRVEQGRSYFPTRTYENSVTLPAGYYSALKVIIGEGKGQNWWCVMFPPMCLTAAQEKEVMADVLTDDEMKLVTSKPKYELRFWIVEKYWELRERLGYSN